MSTTPPPLASRVHGISMQHARWIDGIDVEQIRQRQERLLAPHRAAAAHQVLKALATSRPATIERGDALRLIDALTSKDRSHPTT